MHRIRPAYTLVELLVVTLIISMLAGMVFVGAPAAMEVVRSYKCRNNLRALMTGSASYASILHKYPMGGQEVPTAEAEELETLTTYDRTTPCWSNSFSWATFLLPNLNQDQLYLKYDLKMADAQFAEVNIQARSQPVETYYCPSDDPQFCEPIQTISARSLKGETIDISPSRIRLNYAACYGGAGYAQKKMEMTMPHPGAKSSSNNNEDGINFAGAMFQNGSGVTAGSVSDGLAKTIAFSEVLPIHGSDYHSSPGDGMYCEGGQAFEGCVQPNYGPGDVVGNAENCIEARAENVLFESGTYYEQFQAARSVHNAGVNVAMGDASVRFVSDDVDRVLWWRLCSSRDGESVDFTLLD